VSGPALAIQALEVEEQLPPYWIHYGAAMPEGQTRASAHEACLKQGIRHARDSLHGENRMPDRGSRDTLLAQGAECLQLTKLLECVGLLLRDETGSLPPKQLAGTDLQDA
jgi:hypothetical protein